MISTYAAPLLVLPRPVKRAFVLLIDALLCLVTVWLALCLRLEEWVTFGVTHWLVVLVSVVLALPLFVVNGLYRAIFRYSGWAAMLAVAKAVLIYTVLFAGILFVAQLPGVPRTLGLLQPILLLLAVGASRMAARYLFSGTYANLIRRSTLPKVLVYGAGSAGRQLAAAMANSMEMRAVGFLEDDRYLHGSVLNGLPIYPATDMAHWVQKLDVSHVLLAIPSASRQRRNEILEMARLANVSVRTLPGVDDLINGHVQVSDLRELDIEDLLGRDPVPPDVALLDRNVRGKVVLVTGAGGSIGSELCRQLIRSGPAKLLLVEASEFALYSIYHELEQLLAEQDHSHLELVPLLASVRDEPRLSEIMSTWHPHTVYHAAAYKHVPLVEHNPAEGVRNNVVGTWLTARVAAEQGVADFVLISTDKAVRPTNIMGTTKRLAELVLQALAAQSTGTRFSMVTYSHSDLPPTQIRSLRDLVRLGVIRDLGSA